MYILKKIIIKLISITRRFFNKLITVIGYYNTHHHQKKWTHTAINCFNSGHEYSWGGPLEEKVLGDYIKIKNCFLLPHISNKSVLEIGCLDGKWSQYIVPIAQHTFLVDLSKEILPALQNKLNNPERYTFYETKGYELNGIEDASIDYIFSMDTLVRVNKRFLNLYFKEFKRVIKKNGKILIHLPCITSEGSQQRGFVKLTSNDITRMMTDNGLKEFTLDFNTISHGVLLKYGFCERQTSTQTKEQCEN